MTGGPSAIGAEVEDATIFAWEAYSCSWCRDGSCGTSLLPTRQRTFTRPLTRHVNLIACSADLFPIHPARGEQHGCLEAHDNCHWRGVRACVRGRRAGARPL